jgi:hypothetical protein
MPDNPIDELTFIDELGRKSLRELARALADGRAVLFAGAGLSFNARSRDGRGNRMPSWRDLASGMLEQLGSELKGETDILKIADYYQSNFGRAALIETVRNLVRDHEHKPGPIHQLIAQLSFREIITTNYDTLIERSFEEQYLSPQVVVEDRDLVRRRQPPRIIKMNGCLNRNPPDMVITGDDFLSYATTHPLLQLFVTKSFIETQVLFLGFGLSDPAFLAINERLRRTLGVNSPLSYSLQPDVSKTEMAYWRTRQVHILSLSSGEKTDLTYEERLFRVLSAFKKLQKRELQDLAAPRRVGFEEVRQRLASSLPTRLESGVLLTDLPETLRPFQTQLATLLLLREVCHLDENANGLRLHAWDWQPCAELIDGWLRKIEGGAEFPRTSWPCWPSPPWSF